MMINTNFKYKQQSGFTLVEIAIVLLIASILLAALVPTLSSQMDQKMRSETRKQLEDIKEALIGYAIVNGRLPCPATAASNGTESFAAGGSALNGNCSNFRDGLVPAATLGLSGLNAQGNVVDGWGNPIRYAVTDWGPIISNAFTKSNGMSSAGMVNLSPNLHVCSTTTGSTAANCAVGSYLTLSTSGAPAVIYSAGPNGGAGGGSADETENSDGDYVFVSHDISTNFDDMVVWLSLNTLLNRMVAAGKLP